jgi:hypothetical protein
MVNKGFERALPDPKDVIALSLQHTAHKLPAMACALDDLLNGPALF